MCDIESGLAAEGEGDQGHWIVTVWMLNPSVERS